jgi:hypothetical protein
VQVVKQPCTFFILSKTGNLFHTAQCTALLAFSSTQESESKKVRNCKEKKVICKSRIKMLRLETIESEHDFMSSIWWGKNSSLTHCTLPCSCSPLLSSLKFKHTISTYIITSNSNSFLLVKCTFCRINLHFSFFPFHPRMKSCWQPVHFHSPIV